MQIILVLATLVAAAWAVPADTYNPKYDSFNAVELTENPRLLRNFGKCFLGQVVCTSEGSAFKKIVPEALQTSCGKCTAKQRELVRIIVRSFQKDLPDIWAELVKKHDPNGQYKESFNKFLNANN